MSRAEPVKTSWAGGVLLHLALLAAAGVSVLPFVWLICAAFKTQGDLFSSVLLPWGHLDRLTLGNFTTLFRTRAFGSWVLNSLFLASAQTVLVVTLSSLGGFALAKYQFRFRRVVVGLMLATVLLPAQVLLPSLYELMERLGLVNTYAAVLAPNAISVLGMFLFWQAMRAVPDELLQAGRVDGCSELRLWWSVALPIVRPMVGAFTLLSFLGAWNSFLWPQIVLQDESKYPLPLGLANLMGLQEYQSHYGLLMAATLLSVLPVVILFFALQKDFIAGLSSGAVKG
jgi:ABC-type glycerol-3-phosphate transport system permease component